MITFHKTGPILLLLWVAVVEYSLLVNLNDKALLWSTCFIKISLGWPSWWFPDWLSGPERSMSGALLRSAPQRPRRAAPPAEDELSPCYYDAPADANTQTQCGKTGEQRSSSPPVMNEHETWLISEVCTMSFKVNLVFLNPVRGQFHPLPKSPLF